MSAYTNTCANGSRNRSVIAFDHKFGNGIQRALVWRLGKLADDLTRLLGEVVGPFAHPLEAAAPLHDAIHLAERYGLITPLPQHRLDLRPVRGAATLQCIHQG